MSCVPDFTIPVCNLAKVPEEDLRANVSQNAMLLLLKAIIEKELLRRIGQTLHLVHTMCSDARIMNILELFFNYLALVRPEITPDKLEEEFSRLPEGERVDMYGLFKERWEEYAFNKGAIIGRQEGILLGETKGRQEEACTLVIELLSAQFGIISLSLAEKLRSIKIS